MTGSFKPYPLFSVQTVQQLFEKRKALSVIGKRLGGRDGIPEFINNSTVVFELGEVDSYKVHGFPPLF